MDNYYAKRYYEVNFDTFSIYDYQNKEEALQKAKEWLINECREFQKEILEVWNGRRYNK